MRRVEDLAGGFVVLRLDRLVRALKQEVARVRARLRIGGDQKADESLGFVRVLGRGQPRIDLRAHFGGGRRLQGFPPAASPAGPATGLVRARNARRREGPRPSTQR